MEIKEEEEDIVMALEQPLNSFNKPRRNCSAASFTMNGFDNSRPRMTSIISIRSRKEVQNDPEINIERWKSAGRKDGQNVITALYCKILVLIGICFTLSETLTDKIPSGYYSLFYVYLVLGSLIFLMFLYVDLIRFKSLTATKKKRSWLNDLKKNLFTSSGNKIQNILKRRQSSVEVNDDDIPRPKNVYGSLYLRFGAVGKIL